MSLPPARYSFGGDEHIFVELNHEMSLEAFFKGMSITNAIAQQKIVGVTEICPANASYQVRFDPDLIAPDKLMEILKSIEIELGDGVLELNTRIIEIPVFYNDPWTNETQQRFRERHQDPTSTDLEYGARVNGYANVDAFIAAHAASPWFVSMVGFVAGLPFMFQMVERAKQIQVPKYLRPRTDTPKLTIGHGGCFGCIYSVRGAGGYQMFGITPAPIFDPQQSLPYVKDFMVKFKPINRSAYDAALAKVQDGSFDLRIREVKFSLQDFIKDPSAYNQQLTETLYGN
jgi:urea carboxylase